ncbi:conserved hypothetical protein [Candidatus Zixiibacteriota bacterium]|nr:conserved hypothetical protein [candidate division Zixibacteria bacterium]
MTTFKIDGIIFDLGSTLIEYENIPWELMNLTSFQAGVTALSGLGYELPDISRFKDLYVNIREKYRARARETLKEWTITDAISELFSTAGLNHGKNLADRFFDAYYQPVGRQLTIFDDTIEVLNRLREMKIKIGLVSNTIFPEIYHRDELARFGIAEFLDFAVFSSSFGYRKPHPAIYERAIELIKIDREKLLFVGDRYLEDYSGPSAVGLKAVLKYRPGREYPEPIPDGTVIIHELSELIPLIK